ncbi:hypothetical protein B0H11DRAFT_1902396 [Mycena galericulata]|nr:hypothetical protein B0H11DRAFT_1902396 [Mycena galericulata]
MTFLTSIPTRNSSVMVLKVAVLSALETTDIARWRDSFTDEIQPIARNTIPVFIHSKTTEAVGACILDVIIWLHTRSTDDEPFVMEDRELQEKKIIRCHTGIVFESFLREFRTISMFVVEASIPSLRLILTPYLARGLRPNSTRAVTQGAGPERAALRHACTVLSRRHRFWQQVPSSQMFRPVFTPGAMAIPSRLKTFRAHGMFLALNFFLLQHGPLPISIWLLLSFINGKEALLIPKHILLHIDRGAYDILAPCLISNDRTKEEHEGWVISAFATILLGHPAP